ncbi:MAGE family-domain-containing protein [Ephemerocybe angulata]|uniref:MAGE family-domain-containing protein n=1 Tax=Ephemerocybe angulata TaxID=980116 RepID=A0A8H6HJI0_9AGAR|nr:MAGE family-domain-containing protein [Tulosesus angulatus]
MPPRAGARSQRASEPSQSQPARTQKGAQRGGRSQRQPVEEEEEEDDEDDDDAPTGSMNVDGDEEVTRRAHDLVRIALFMEHRRLPLRRDDITKKVLAPHTRLFTRVFAAAQGILRDTFALELVELPSRAGLDQENANEPTQGAAEDHLTQARKATGMKKKSAATGSKSYILRSTLHPTLIDLAAQTDENILEEEAADFPSDDESDDNGDDDEGERPPRSFGSIISWSHTEQVGPIGILYVVLALILANGRVLPDNELRAYLRQLHLPANRSPVHFSTASTTRSLTIDNYLFQLQKQHYLERRAVGETGKGAGNKRVRATQATRDDENSNQMYEWRWGIRAMAEVGERKIAEFVGEFMVDGDPAARNRDAREKKAEAMVAGIEKAAGSKLTEIA